MAISAEAKTITLVAAIQLVSGLDFTMVQPLGPDLTRGLGVAPSMIGYVTGIYAFSAFLVGLLGARLFDRFDRRRALGVAIIGLVCATGLCAISTGLVSLLVARALAGACAGPVLSLSYAIIADLIPPERRGRAIATTSISGSISTVIGLPIGIKLAEIEGWRAPFLCIAVGGLITAVLATRALPSMRAHLSAEPSNGPRLGLLRRPSAVAGVVCATISAASGYAVTSNIASHIQINLHFPRAQLGNLYMVGGIIVFLVAPFSGRAIDRFGSWAVMLVSNIMFGAALCALFIADGAGLPIMLLFTCNMLGNYLRNASLQTLLTKIPSAQQRAGFLSLTGAMQQLGAAVGSGASSLILTVGPGPSIVGMAWIGWTVLALTVVLTPLTFLIGHLRKTEYA